MILLKHNSDVITLLLRTLQWLPTSLRVKTRVTSLTSSLILLPLVDYAPATRTLVFLRCAKYTPTTGLCAWTSCSPELPSLMVAQFLQMALFLETLLATPLSLRFTLPIPIPRVHHKHTFAIPLSCYVFPIPHQPKNYLLLVIIYCPLLEYKLHQHRDIFQFYSLLY